MHAVTLIGRMAACTFGPVPKPKSIVIAQSGEPERSDASWRKLGLVRLVTDQTMDDYCKSDLADGGRAGRCTAFGMASEFALACDRGWLFVTPDPYVTTGVRDLPAAVLSNLFDRHMRLEQGALSDDDHAANAAALVNGGRLLSCFALLDRRVWVITEAAVPTDGDNPVDGVDGAPLDEDRVWMTRLRVQTTILLPEEY